MCAELLQGQGGDLPRRATVVNARVVDRADVAASGGLPPPEVEQLSRACERLCAALGRPVWPRDTRALLQLCLSGASRAWRALHADCLSGDVDRGAAVAAIERDPAALADAIVRVEDPDDLASMAGCLGAVLPALSQDGARALGERLAPRLPALMEVLGRHATRVSRDLRDALLKSVGRALKFAGLGPEAVADAVLGALRNRREGLLRLFLQLDVGAAARERPELFDELLRRAPGVHPDERYASLVLLLRVVHSRGGRAAFDPTALAKLKELAVSTVRSASQRPGDARLLLACAGLACAVAPDTPEGQVARALEACAAALVDAADSGDGGA